MLKNAKEALELAQQNTKIYKEEQSEKDRLQKIKEEQHQKEVDEKWKKEAIEHGENIIKCIIENAGLLGIGKAHKRNGYYRDFNCGGAIRTYMWDYTFVTKISDQAAKDVEKYFTDLGYGCQVIKFEEGRIYDTKGTIYCWIPDPEKDNPLNKDKNDKIYSEISW